jgi:hypothetical protein
MERMNTPGSAWRVVVLHTDAIAENRTTGPRTRRVDGNDANLPAFAAQRAHELVDQGALPCPGCAGDAGEKGSAGVREQFGYDLFRFGPAVFDGSGGSREGARVAEGQGQRPILAGEARACRGARRF